MYYVLDFCLLNVKLTDLLTCESSKPGDFSSSKILRFHPKQGDFCLINFSPKTLKKWPIFLQLSDLTSPAIHSFHQNPNYGDREKLITLGNTITANYLCTNKNNRISTICGSFRCLEKMKVFHIQNGSDLWLAELSWKTADGNCKIWRFGPKPWQNHCHHS